MGLGRQIEVKQPAPSQAAAKRLGWDLNTGSLALNTMLLTILFVNLRELQHWEGWPVSNGDLQRLSWLLSLVRVTVEKKRPSL